MDLVIRNARVMTCTGPGLGLVDHGAIAIEAGKLAWVGADGDAPRATHDVDAGGMLVTPGLVDCHTHAIFADDRADEFALRAAGKGYLEIAAAGGGIAATVAATCAAGSSAMTLLAARLDAARVGGTTTMEVKSGYGLSIERELGLLAVIHASALRNPRTRVVATLLAHLVPPEREHDRTRFVAEWCDEIVVAAAGSTLATSVDVYCDEGAFTLDEARAIWTAAQRAGLAIRGHVGQFRDLGAAEVLAELGGLSADHLEQVSDRGIAALAAAGTVAVMLPGACVQLRLPVPPVEQLRAAGVAMAVATDLNPGSSYCETLPIQMWLATTHFGMTVEEAWLGVTRHAAKALGVAAGTLAPGAPADLVIWRCDTPAAVPYRYGANLVDAVYLAGEPVAGDPRCLDKLSK